VYSATSDDCSVPAKSIPKSSRSSPGISGRSASNRSFIASAFSCFDFPLAVA
jgi:hypothetical protein